MSDTSWGGEAPDIAWLAVTLLDARVPFCLVTVVVAGRDAGVRAGEKLVVYADGRVDGTLSAATSATLVAQVVRAAVAQIERGEIRLARFDAQGNALAERRSMRGAAPEPSVVEVSLEPMLPPPRVIIVGAGHIAVPLARLAKVVGFEVTVIDDRERFASRERFPEADDIIVEPFDTAIARQQITPWTYLVLVTRGHEYDEATLQRVLGSPAPYIGMIGSRRRVLVVFERLSRLGVPEQFLDRIYAPIGLDIGARTPEEIALAIMAEIVNVRRGGNAASLALRLRGRKREVGASAPV